MKVCVCIVGCKLDLHDQSQFTYQQGCAAADKMSAALGRDVFYAECSAKTGEGVQAIMARIMRQVQKQRQEHAHQQLMKLEATRKEENQQCLIS